MQQKHFGWIYSVAIGFGLIFGFQNCGSGFSALENGSSGLSSVGSQGVNTLSLLPTSTNLYTVQDINFKLSGALANSASTIKWSNVFSGSSPCTDDVNEEDTTQYGVNCSVPGILVVNVSAIDDNGILQARSFTASVLTNPNPWPTGGDKATFTIASGTGNNSWNTSASTIELYIGMTLTIKNGDTVSHQLHVNRYDSNAALNGHPCAHEADPMLPGGSYDCVITKTYDPATDPIIYDHNAGGSARFYLRAYDGAALYATNCASCHGALATTLKRGKLFADINSSIMTNGSMKGIASLTALTAVQRKAIAFALKK